MLDTDILVDVLRGYPPAVDWFSTLTDLPTINGLVIMELIKGCGDQAQVRRVRSLIAPLSVVWPKESDCQEALKRFPDMHLRTGAGVLDALIGAAAFGCNSVLCTFNRKHYEGFEGLLLEAPYRK